LFITEKYHICSDLLDTGGALHPNRVTAIGTRLDGLLTMGVGTLRPTLLVAVVLNDVGPEICQRGCWFPVRETPNAAAADRRGLAAHRCAHPCAGR
jgi:hypothetical protein